MRVRIVSQIDLLRWLMLGLGLVAFLPANAQSFQSTEHAFRVVTLVRGLDQPWGLAFLPDGRMLVTEKAGRLRIVANGKLDPKPIAGVPEVTVHGQGGLMDVAIHPQFAETGWIYLSYAARGADGVGTEVARGKLTGERLENVEVIFRQQPKGSTGRHFGSRLVFDRAGYLYITLGD